MHGLRALLLQPSGKLLTFLITYCPLIFCSKMTDVYEGSLIRLFRRLEELLRQIAQAAKVMGSEELEQKFTASLGLVRRDLVAAQSLYL